MQMCQDLFFYVGTMNPGTAMCLLCVFLVYCHSCSAETVEYAAFKLNLEQEALKTVWD